MKKLLFFLLILTISRSLLAQSPLTISSQTAKLNSCYSKSELICSENKYAVIYNNVINTFPTKHKFIVQDTDSRIKKEFCLTTNFNQEFNILDIELKHGICYFCGSTIDNPNQYTYDPEHGWMNTSTLTGFIGYFDINEVLSWTEESHTNYDYHIINITETEKLTRIAVDEPGLIYAVGYPDQCPFDENNMRAASCVVCLEKNQAHSDRWYYDVLYPAHAGEMLMDVTAGGDGIYLVSRFQDDNYTFGVRHMKMGPLRHEGNRQEINYLHKFRTNDVGLSFFGYNVTWRDNYCPIFVDNHTVGYACSNNIHNRNGLMIYRLILSAANIVTSAYSQFIPTSPNVDLLELKEFNSNYVKILIKDPSLNRSTIKSANWSATSIYPQQDLYSSLTDAVIADIVPHDSDKYLLSIGHRANDFQTIENSQHISHASIAAETCLNINEIEPNYPLDIVYETIGDTLDIRCLNQPINATSTNYIPSIVETTYNCTKECYTNPIIVPTTK